MRRLPALLLPLALLSAVVCAPASAEVRRGPAGNAFYTPPAKLPGKRHGDPIWVRRLTGPAAQAPASRNLLVLYRSVGSDGKPVAVSGTISLPRGKAPDGGWPVITYAHATTGIADECAPSRDTVDNPAHAYSAYSYPLFSRWLRRGYALLRTDYQGLGTPGVHEYLVGEQEGRSTLDIVRAAHKVDRRVSRRVAIAGHSQGGHAALWATALAPTWTPDLTVRSTVAFAPASHIADEFPAIGSLHEPGGGLTAELGLIARGVDTASPALNVPALLTDKSAPFYPETLTKCLPTLGRSDSLGGVAPADLLRSDADTTALLKALSANDPENLKIRTAVAVEQGGSDTTVFKAVTDQLVDELRAKGTKIAYRTYSGVSHAGIVNSGAPDATRFIGKHFGR